jgi:O-antigen/teichoic acid export membrane protein
MDSSERALINRVAADMLRLLGASGVAQAIAFAAAPLITRLYSPEAFGHFAVFTAVIGLLLPLASLRYDWAVPLPPEEARAHEIVALCVVLILLSAAAAALLGLAARPFLPDRVEPSDVPLLPLAMFLMGLHALMTSWLVRCGAFTRLALVRMATIVGTVACQIGIGRVFPDAAGLILGLAAGHLCGLLAAADLSCGALSKSLATLSRRSLRRTASEYRAFALLTAPFGMVNLIGAQAPSLVLPWLYGMPLAGQYSLAQRVLAQPAALVGRAVGQVMWGNTPRLYLENPARLWKLFIRISAVLFVLMLPGLLLAPFGGAAFALLFGPAWRQAGHFAGIMIFAEVLGLPALGTSSLTAFRLNHWLSGWEIARALLIAGALWLAWRSAVPATLCVVGIAATHALCYAALFGLNALAIARAKSRAAWRRANAATA